MIEFNNGYFGVTSDSGINQLSGIILMCNKKVEFNSSGEDGNNNYFGKNKLIISPHKKI